MITIPAPTMLNYAILSIVSLYLDYYFMNSVSELRHKYSLLIWWGYLLFDNLVDEYFAYLTEFGGVSFDVGPVHAVWAYVSAVLVFCVVCIVWKGDPVQVGMSAVMADLFAGTTSTLGILSANLATGIDPGAGYIRPFGIHTIIASCVMAATALVIRVPATSIMRTVARVVHRHRLPWAVLMIPLIAIFSSISLVGYGQLGPWFGVMPVIELAAAVVFALILLRNSRDVTQRGALLSQCLATTNAYIALAGERLGSFERDLAALEGHEESLERLRVSEGGRLDERIGKLREAYERLSSMSFCDRPALDAILVSSADRLRNLGIRPEFSVAGLVVNQSADVPLAMSLLNLACGAAAQQEDAVVQDSEVGFRVRGHGESMLYRLDVPAAWGYLGAKRSLTAVPGFDSLLVQERVRDGRTIVLVMSGVGE